MTSYLGTMRRLNRDTRLIVGSGALAFFGVFGIYGVLFNLYLVRLGYGPQFIGLANGVGFLTGAAACLPAAEVGRRWGCRRTAIAGLALLSLFQFLLPLAQWLPPGTRSPWLVATYSLIYLSGLGLWGTNIDPFLMQVVAEHERNHAFSLSNALVSGGIFLGALLAGLLPGAIALLLGTTLADPSPYALLLLGAGLASALAAFMLLATREGRAAVGTAAKGEATAGRVPVAVIAAMVLVTLIAWAGSSCTNTFYNVYLDEELRLSTASIGTIIAIGSLLAVPAALAAPLVLGRLGNRSTYIACYVGVGLSAVLLALVARWQVALLAYIAMQALAGMAGPAKTVYQMMIVPQQWRPAMSASVMMAAGLGRAVFAFGGGQIIIALGYRSLFLTGAGLFFAGVLFFWGYFGRPAREQPVRPEAAV